jgi:hypothetical protein
MEIAENVNPGGQERQFSQIAFDYRENMQSQILVCDRSRYL